MTTRIPLLSPSSSRRALHERSPSQNNQINSVRLVEDEDQGKSGTKIYASNPYPTKPEHILVPTAGNRYVLPSPSYSSFASTSPSPFGSFGRSSILTNTLHGEHSSGLWANEEAKSSNNSFPLLEDTHAVRQVRSLDVGDDAENHACENGLEKNEGKRQVEKEDDEIESSVLTALIRGGSLENERTNNEEQPTDSLSEDQHHELTDSGDAKKSERSNTERISADENEGCKDDEGDLSDHSSDGSIIALPRTIRAVEEDFSSLHAFNFDGSASFFSGSSPNIEPIRSSSPNIVPLNRSSSPNFVPLGGSSPNFVQIRPSNSSLYSANSVGTSRRYDHSNIPELNLNRSSSFGSRGQGGSSIPSSPPVAPLRSFSSVSSFGLPPNQVRSRADTSSSGISTSDIQSAISAGVAVQYPIVRAPSSISLRAHSSHSLSRSASTTSLKDSSWRRKHGHLPAVPSEHSAELLGRSVVETHPSDEAEVMESKDHLTQLRAPPLNHKASTHSLKSSHSRTSSLVSIARPTSSSEPDHIRIPRWARNLYQTPEPDNEISIIALADSRPTTAQSGQSESEPARAISRNPTSLFRPRTRPHDRPTGLPSTDPRSHWLPDPDMVETAPPSSGAPTNWSPHLHADKRADRIRRSMWTAPSLDEAAESLFNLRNAQVFSFILGFVCPLSKLILLDTFLVLTRAVWLLAAILPLPSLTSRFIEQGGEDVENAFHNRVDLVDEIRWENARWWRNLNRCMSAVGVIVITVVVCSPILDEIKLLTMKDNTGCFVDAGCDIAEFLCHRPFLRFVFYRYDDLLITELCPKNARL